MTNGLPARYEPATRKPGVEILLFGLAPIGVAIVRALGLVGGLADAEALVPVYLIGLNFAIAAVGIYAVSLLFRLIRRIAAGVR